MNGSERKDVIVTGGAGMIGSALTEELLDMGYTVTVIDNLSRGRKEFIPDDAYFINSDLRVVGYDVRQAFEQADYVFHLAAMIGGVQKMHESQFESAQNVLIDRHVLDLCAKYNTPVYYQSTACIYPVGKQTKSDTRLRLGEYMADPAEPESLYGWAKLFGEKMTQAMSKEFDIPVGIGRPFNVVGPREADHVDTSHVIPALIQKTFLAKENDTNKLIVWGTGKQQRSFISVRDCVRGIIKISKNPSINPRNIGHPKRWMIKTVAEKIRDEANYHHGMNLELEFDTSKPEGVYTRAPNLNRLIGLGWKVEDDLEAIISRTYKWWMDEGWDLVREWYE